MDLKAKFREIIEAAVIENASIAPGLKKNLPKLLKEFDRSEEVSTFRGVYRFLEKAKEKAQEKWDDFFTGYEFCGIEALQMARDTHLARKLELKLFLDGKEIDPGRTSIGGEPEWEQFEEHPVCPRCDQNMTLVFQLDSLAQLSANRDIPLPDEDYGFGDVGIVRFFRCQDCNEFEANWECG